MLLIEQNKWQTGWIFCDSESMHVCDYNIFLYIMH